MKNFLIASTVFLCSLVNEATAQFSYPRFFQQVNRPNTNRFTTVQSYRWEAFIDSTTSDTIRITPSAGVNIYSIVAGPTRSDSVTKKHTIVSNNGNSYLNDKMTINVMLATDDSLLLGTGFSSQGNTLYIGPGRFTILIERTSSGEWVNYSSMTE